MNVVCIVVFLCETQYCAKENSTMLLMLEFNGSVSQTTRDNFD